MGRKSKAKFELKGHTLPGINQKSETANIKDGRSPSSAFQQKSSPNKIIGLAAGLLAKPLIKGVKNLFDGDGDDEGGGDGGSGGKLLEDTGKTVSQTKGFVVDGGGDATGDATGDVTGDATGDTTAATTEIEPAGGGTATTGTETEEEV